MTTMTHGQPQLR